MVRALSLIVAEVQGLPDSLKGTISELSDGSLINNAVGAASREDQRPGLVSLIEHFAVEVCEKKWGISNLWSQNSAMATAASRADHPMMRMLHAHGLKADAFAARRALCKDEVTTETLQLLLDMGLDLAAPYRYTDEESPMPGLELLLKTFERGTPARKKESSPQYEKLRHFYQQRPELLQLIWGEDGMRFALQGHKRT
jgi:hypothetical protein